MHKIIVAIDGYSSCGKSTTAKGLANYLGYTYIDSGAMYRATTLYFHDKHISLSNNKQIEQALLDIDIDFRRNKDGKNETFLNGINVENEIRKLYIANMVSEVSALPAVRHEMVEKQRKMGKKKGVVMDGRDIGTVVFPEAEMKVFMTADKYVRAHRRQIELAEKGDLLDIEDIVKNLEKRDFIDTTRKESPLTQAEDAIMVDTTHMTLDEQIEMLTLIADEIVSQKIRNK